MEESSARELRPPSKFQFREHFIRHWRVCDIGFADSGVTFGQAALIDALGHVKGYDGAQIAGMDTVAARAEGIAHGLVHFVDSGNNRSNQSASRHNYVYRINRYGLRR